VKPEGRVLAGDDRGFAADLYRKAEVLQRLEQTGVADAAAPSSASEA
jgi:hypothetical protein